VADDTYTTLLNFVSETSAADTDIKNTTENLKKMETQVEKIGKSSAQALGGISFPGDELSADFDLFVKAYDKTFQRVGEKTVDLRSGLKATLGDLQKFSRTSVDALKAINLGDINIERIKEGAKKAGQEISDELAAGLASGNLTEADYIEIEAIEKQIKGLQELEEARREDLKGAIQASSIKSRLLTREASLLRKQAADIRENAQILRNQSQQLASISQVSLAIGTGIVGGIFGFAAKYVNSAKEATTVTAAWKKAQDSLKESGEKTGAVFAQVALPLLQKAADTAAKAASFIEKHPEIIQAALNAGLIAAGLGAVGLAVSKGIKLYADQLYLSSIPLQLEAGKLQFAAAREQLVAARLRAGAITPDQAIPTSVPSSTQKVPGIGNALGTLAKVTLVATSVIIGAELGLTLGNAIAKLIDPNSKDMTMRETLFYGGVRAIEAIEQKWFTFLGNIGKSIPDLLGGKALRHLGEAGNKNLQKVDKFFQELLLGADELGKAAEKLSGVRGSANFEAVLKAYEDYKRDDLAIIQKHYAERSKVISDALRAEAKSNEEFARNAARIRSQMGKSIADATASYEQQSIQAEQQYAQERARIIRDSGIEIQRIEEQLQENLRKLRLDHEDRIEELVASRDALGILKEQQSYERARSEEIRQANQEIRQRREDLALRLQDLAENYAQEKAQRYAEFQTRLEEIRNNAAEQLRELTAQHQAEIAEIRANAAQRVKELDDQLKEERKRRYDYFIAQLQDLDANLLGEKALRKQRQDEMIAELDAFLLRYKAGMGTLLAAPPPKASGGYATYGTYLLGDAMGGGRGKTEYVLGGDVTELAERVMGGRISRSKMIAMLSAVNGGSRNNVTYNDSRRIESRVSDADRQRMIDDTLDALSIALE